MRPPLRERQRSGSILQCDDKPRTELSLGLRAFSYAAPAAWNSLPPTVHNSLIWQCLKRRLKTELLHRMFYE